MKCNPEVTGWTDGWMMLVGHGWASCLVWKKQAESYSPVWPRGTPCPRPSLANACTLSWSMDDLLVAAMRAGARWKVQTYGWTNLHTPPNPPHTHTIRYKRQGGAVALCRKGDEELCQPGIIALKLMIVFRDGAWVTHYLSKHLGGHIT